MASRNTRKRSALRAEMHGARRRNEARRADTQVYVDFLARMGVTEGDPEYQVLLSEAQEVGYELFFGDEL